MWNERLFSMYKALTSSQPILDGSGKGERRKRPEIRREKGTSWKAEDMQEIEEAYELT